MRRRHPSGMPHAEVVGTIFAVADALDYAHSRACCIVTLSPRMPCWVTRPAAAAHPTGRLPHRLPTRRHRRPDCHHHGGRDNRLRRARTTEVAPTLNYKPINTRWVAPRFNI